MPTEISSKSYYLSLNTTRVLLTERSSVGYLNAGSLLITHHNQRHISTQKLEY